MKKFILGISVFVLTAGVVVSYPFMQSSATAKVINDNATTKTSFNQQRQPLIQLAILLDTSSSMDGLINQAREQLWQVVNKFAESKKDGVTPRMEVAVYEYGNSNLTEQNGYIRRVSALTSELDGVSEGLFGLSTNGGDEYCGFVIKTAVNELNWSKDPNSVKMIFIAGNEPFTQGPVPFQEAIKLAKQKGITVNTIHAGNANDSEVSSWKNGAIMAGGNFMTIDQNVAVAHYQAPQDQRLQELNSQLNQTYVPYGNEGRKKAERQAAIDMKNQSISSGLAAKRTISKASKLYSNEKWDLVDAIDKGKVDLDKLNKDAMPAPMQNLGRAEQKAYVAEKAKERKDIQEEIVRLSKQRDQFIAKKRQQAASVGVGNTMEDALSEAVTSQAKAKGYSFQQP